jgi:hypothetical protein
VTRLFFDVFSSLENDCRAENVILRCALLRASKDGPHAPVAILRWLAEDGSYLRMTLMV